MLHLREKISHSEAVRRAIDRFCVVRPADDLRSFFGARTIRGNISRQVVALRREWSNRNPTREGFRS